MMGINAALKTAGLCGIKLAVSVAIWLLVGIDGSYAADESQVVGPHFHETGPGVESPDEERGRVDAIEKIRRKFKRTLAILSAENGTDPTAIIGQLSPRTRYQDHTSDQRLQEIARVSLPLSPDWLLRVDVPFTYLDPKDSNEKAVAGLSNIRARLGWRILNKEDGSFFIGSEFYLPTSTNPRLGANYYEVGPTIVGSLHLPDLRSNAFIWIEYLTAVTGRLGGGLRGGVSTDDTSTSESRIRLRFNTVWSKTWWSFVEPRFFVDWTQRAKTGSVLLFEGGRRLDEHWKLYVRPEVGLWGKDVPGAFNYGVEVGVRYMFYMF
jgi:hypothetical protein